MRPFSCPVTILNTLDPLGKFDGMADEGFLVGYSNTDSDAAFGVKELKFKGEKPESEVHVSPSNSTKTKKHDDKTMRDAKGKTTRTRSMTRMVKDQGGLTQINNEDFHTCMFTCFLSQEEPKRVHQALKDPSWIESMQEELLLFKMQKEELLQFKMQKVWVLVDLSYGKRSIGTKWVFRNKKDERGIVVRNKARLVAQGHTQEEGINYEEVFAPVTRIEAIRLFLAYASFMEFMVYQMDVKSVFLYETIEEEKKDGIFISQDKYVAEILRKFGLTDKKSASTPIDTKKPLLKDPDVCTCARFQVTPKALHLHAVKRIFRYLKGKPQLGLWYLKDSPFDLVAYSDSDYAGASLDRKSTTRGCQFLGCRLISWQCKKQTVVATSSTEAEYVRFQHLVKIVVEAEVIVVELEVIEVEGWNRWFFNSSGNNIISSTNNPFSSNTSCTASATPSPTSYTTNIPSKRGVSTPENPLPTSLILANTFWVRAGKVYLVEGGIIANIDADKDVILEDAVLEDAKDVADVEEREESEPAELQEVVNVVTTANIITKVVTAASDTITTSSTTLTTAEVPIPAAKIDAAPTLTTAPSRRRKSAFLYETIEEEVYVCQPPGFEDPDYPDKVYKVVKALYGLHQAPRVWYKTLDNYLLENGFQRGKIDQTLFIKRQKGDILLVQIYVDDIIFGLTNKDLCKAFEKLTKDKFQTSSMGKLTFFLGLQLKQKKDRIFISQDKYIAEILRKFRLIDGKSTSTPIDTEKPLMKDPNGEDVDVHTYRSMIGSLKYLTSLRPDIMFAVNDVTKLQALVEKKKMVITKASIRDALRLDDAEGFSGVETPPIEGMIVEQKVAEVADEVHDEGVPAAGIVAEGDVSAANDEVLTVVEEPYIPSRTPPTPPPQPSQDILSTSQVQPTPPQSPQDKVAQALEISKLKPRVKKLKRRNKASKLKRLKKDVVLEDAKDDAVEKSVDVDEANDDIHGRKADSQAEIYKIDLEHAKTVLSMQEEESEPAELQKVVDVVATTKIITEVVTAASTTITVADVPIPVATIAAAPTLTAALSRRRKEVEPKPLKKQAQIKQDEQYARELKDKLNKNIDWDEVIDHVQRKQKEDKSVKRYQALKRKPQTEAQARINMMIYLKNVAGFKMDYFNGMSYDDIRPIFEKYFDSNVAFLKKTKEQMDEEDMRAFKRLNESQKEKAAKKQKLEEEVEELKRHLQIVPNDDDDVYTEATPLALKVHVVDYEIYNQNNKPYYKIKRADGLHQLYLSFLSLLRNFDREDLEALWRLVKERFATTKPKNFSDDFMLITLGAMFEKPDIHAQI
nr:uncharacterized mitochondrial protein AtMg00810-like [Tanacetum cinerariifolium]